MCGQQLYISCKHRLPCATICCLGLAPFGGIRLIFDFFGRHTWCSARRPLQPPGTDTSARRETRRDALAAFSARSVIPRESPQRATVLWLNGFTSLRVSSVSTLPTLASYTSSLVWPGLVPQWHHQRDECCTVELKVWKFWPFFREKGKYVYYCSLPDGTL